MNKFKDIAENYLLVGITLALCVFFSLWPETSATFPTSANLQVIAGNQAVLGVVALAALIPLVSNQFDLSVGATLGLSSVVTATLLGSGLPLLVAIAAALLVGAVVGVVNGVLTTSLRVSAVMITLGVAIVIHGIVVWKTGGNSLTEGIPVALTEFGGATTLGLPNTFIVMLGVACLVYYILEFTPFGRHLYALGSNATAARLVGLNTRRLTILSFVAAGVLAAAAGVLQVSRSGSANPQIGEGFTLPALAAAFLSAAAVQAGKFNTWGVIVAIFFLAALNGGLNLAGAEVYVTELVNGTALIVGVGVSGILGRSKRQESVLK